MKPAGIFVLTYLLAFLTAKVGLCDFNLAFQFNGSGSVTVTTEALISTNYTSSQPIIFIQGKSASLAAFNRALSFNSNISDVDINANQNLDVAINNLILGTSFEKWTLTGADNSGTYISSTVTSKFVSPGNFDPFVADVTAEVKFNTLATTAQFSINGNIVNGTLSGSTASVNWLDFKDFLTPDGLDNSVKLILNNGGGPAVESTPFDLDVFTPSSVPEPSSFALLGLAALGFATRKRLFAKKQKSSDL